MSGALGEGTTALPPTRREALYGDRVVACFVDRAPSLHAMFERARAARPQHDAIVCDGRTTSYAALGRAADRLAVGFAGHGIGVGDRVVMLIGNRPEFIVVLLALARLGAIAVPVGVREQRPGLAFIAAQCGARAIVFDDELGERIPDRAEAPALQARWAVGELAALAAPTALVAPTAPTALAGAPTSDADPHTDPGTPAAHVPRETDTAVILYTSGTTGHPKGAMLTHLSIAHSVRHFEVGMALGAPPRPQADGMQHPPAAADAQSDEAPWAQERSALAVPASHVTGLIAIIATMWQVGGAVVVVREFKAEAFVRLMAEARVTHTLMVPAMYALCLRCEALGQLDLSAWRTGGYGGAPMPVATIDALAERLPGLRLLNAYGATETTSPATLMPAALTRDHADSVGLALPTAEIRVMDDAGCEVAPGETGELWIGGPMVVPGYWANPEATAASFTAGFWHSGDLGSVDARGFVRIVDRKKDMLNRGGFKVYSVEVENVLMAWPGVLEAAVVGRPCAVLGERVHAFVYAPGAAPDTEALRRHGAAHLADYKVPETITWCEAPMPRNANGKVLKRVLRQA